MAVLRGVGKIQSKDPSKAIQDSHTEAEWHFMSHEDTITWEDDYQYPVVKMNALWI